MSLNHGSSLHFPLHCCQSSNSTLDIRRGCLLVLGGFRLMSHALKNIHHVETVTNPLLWCADLRQQTVLTFFNMYRTQCRYRTTWRNGTISSYSTSPWLLLYNSNDLLWIENVPHSQKKDNVYISVHLNSQYLLIFVNTSIMLKAAKLKG